LRHAQVRRGRPAATAWSAASCSHGRKRTCCRASHSPEMAVPVGGTVCAEACGRWGQTTKLEQLPRRRQTACLVLVLPSGVSVLLFLALSRSPPLPLRARSLSLPPSSLSLPLSLSLSLSPSLVCLSLVSRERQCPRRRLSCLARLPEVLEPRQARRQQRKRRRRARDSSHDRGGRRKARGGAAGADARGGAAGADVASSHQVCAKAGSGGGGGWGGMLDDSMRAATAPPKDERDAGRRWSGGGGAAGDGPAWLGGDSRDDEWSASTRAALKSSQGLGLQDLNASLRQNDKGKRLPLSSESRQDRGHKQQLREKVLRARQARASDRLGGARCVPGRRAPLIYNVGDDDWRGGGHLQEEASGGATAATAAASGSLWSRRRSGDPPSRSAIPSRRCPPRSAAPEARGLEPLHRTVVAAYARLPAEWRRRVRQLAAGNVRADSVRSDAGHEAGAGRRSEGRH